MLSYDWRPLGYRLIGLPRVSDIAREEHDEQNRRERMLATWLQLEGTRATYRCLVDVLEKLGNKQTAEKVVRLVEEGGEWCGDVVMWEELVGGVCRKGRSEGCVYVVSNLMVVMWLAVLLKSCSLNTVMEEYEVADVENEFFRCLHSKLCSVP